MSQYTKLDGLVIAKIAEARQRCIPALSFEKVNSGDVREECRRLADATGRDAYRVLDGRLQAMRKQKRIVFVSRVIARGWALPDNAGNDPRSRVD